MKTLNSFGLMSLSLFASIFLIGCANKVEIPSKTTEYLKSKDNREQRGDIDSYL